MFVFNLLSHWTEAKKRKEKKHTNKTCVIFAKILFYYYTYTGYVTPFTYWGYIIFQKYIIGVQVKSRFRRPRDFNEVPRVGIYVIREHLPLLCRSFSSHAQLPVSD